MDHGDDSDGTGRLDKDQELSESRERRRRDRAEDVRELWAEIRLWRKWVHKLRGEVQIAVLVGDRLEKLESKLDKRAEVTSTTLASLGTQLTEVSTVKGDFKAYIERLDKEAAEKKKAEELAAALKEKRDQERRVHMRWLVGIVITVSMVILQIAVRFFF